MEKTHNKIPIFISYSRKDRAFVDELEQFLSSEGFHPLIDRHDIAEFEQWWPRIKELIGQADTVIFLISPDAVASDICAKEVAFAESLNKRIAPVVCRSLGNSSAPESLSKLNYVFLDGSQPIDEARRKLLDGLKTDLEWIREHTRIGELARRWDLSGRSASRLLRGDDISTAESWAARRPKEAPTLDACQLALIRESRTRAENERKRERFRARAINISALTVVVGVLAAAWVFWGQYQDALGAQSLYLADLARKEIDDGNAVTAQLLSIEALPDDQSTKLTQILRPYIAQAELSLQTANEHESWHDHVIGGPFTDEIAWAASADAALIATSPRTSDTATIQYTKKAEASLTLKGEKGFANHLTFSPNGERLVTVSTNARVQIWDTITGERIGEFTCNGDHDTHVSLSKDGNLAACFGSVHHPEIEIWDIASKRQLSTISDLYWWVSRAVFSPTGDRVLLLSNKGGAGLFETATGNLVAKLGPRVVVDVVINADFSSDGKLIAIGVSTARKGEALIWDTRAVKLLHILEHPDGLIGIKFSPDDTSIVTASNDGTARIWNLASGKEIQVFEGHKAAVWSANFNHDGTRILTASEDKTARLWDAGTGKLLNTLRGHENGLIFAAFGEDPDQIITQSRKAARLWTRKRNKALLTVKLPCTGDIPGSCYMSSAAFSPDGRQFVTGAGDGIARIWEIGTGKLLVELKGHKAATTSVVYSPDAKFILTASVDGTARQWDAMTGTLLKTYEVGGTVGSAVFSPDGNSILTASTNKTIRQWNRQTGKPELTFRGHQGWVTQADYAPHGELIVSAGLDSTARLWNIATGDAAAVFHLKGEVANARFCSDGKTIVAAPFNDAEIWDVENRVRTTVLKGHRNPTSTARCSPDGKRIVTGSADGEVRLWDVGSGATIAVLSGHSNNVTDAAFSADGAFVVTTSSDGSAKIWQVYATTQELVNETKQQLPYCLTAEQRKQFHLSTKPPRWCYSMRKWPYNRSSQPIYSLDEWLGSIVKRTADQVAAVIVELSNAFAKS